MSVTHFQDTCQALIQLAIEAFASAPHLTPAQKKIRTEAVVRAIMAFLPTEPIQVMLASQAVGHHLALMDTFQQIHNRALPDNISVKMRTISCAESRMMLALVKESRMVRKDMIAAAEAERSAPPPRAEPAPVTPAPEPAPVPDTETVDDATFAAHLQDFGNAIRALQTTLEETRPVDKSITANAHLAAIAPPGLAARVAA